MPTLVAARIELRYCKGRRFAGGMDLSFIVPSLSVSYLARAGALTVCEAPNGLAPRPPVPMCVVGATDQPAYYLEYPYRTRYRWLDHSSIPASSGVLFPFRWLHSGQAGTMLSGV